MFTSSYELIFEAPSTIIPGEALQAPAQAPTPGTMRIQITSNFEAPDDAQRMREQLLAMAHMGPEWSAAGLQLMDVRRIEECQISIMG